MSRKASLAILTFTLISLSAGCRAVGQSNDRVPTPVKVKAAQSFTSNSRVRYSAGIIPRTQIELAFKVAGYVEILHQVRGVDGQLRDVQEGDVVPKGTVLARVRQSDYQVRVSQAESQVSEALSALDAGKAQIAEAQSALAASRSQLAEATATFERAKLDFDRANNLFASQSMTKSNYDAAKAQFDIAAASLSAAGSKVAMMQAREATARSQVEAAEAKVRTIQALVQEAKIPLQDTELRAPIDGIVIQKSIEVGTLVAQNKTGFLIADTSSVKAIFGVPDAVVGNIKLGSPLDIHTEALPGTDFRGQITAISPAADLKSRVFDVEVTIPNSRQSLKSGMIAAIELTTEIPDKQVLTIPISAVVRAKEHPDQYAVFVVEAQGGSEIARQRIAKLGEALGNTITVLAGVSADERVIVTGATLVTDGQAVQIVP